MALKKITGKDFKEAVDWLWGHKAEGGCVHQVLGTTNDGTELCFVVGWSKGTDYGDDDKKYGYFDEGYCISAKIGYQHRNNAMQTDYDWDFNMPYDLETGDVWDTSSYVPRDADWEREAADYNKEAEKIWAAYGDPDGKNFWDDDKAPLDLMESKKKESLADNANLDFKVGDFKGTQKSVISKIKKALDSKGIANEVVADGRCLEVTLDNANVVIQTIAAGGYGSNKSASYVVLGKDSDNYRNQTDAYSIKDVMDYIEAVKGGKSEAKKPICSMQKKKESLAKKTEMVRPEDPDELKVGKYTADVLTADGDFILSLPAFYDDVAETVKAAKDYLQEESDYVKDTGLVPSKIHVTTVVAKRGWNMPQFVKDVDLNATEAKKPACSMQKKKESLSAKKSEAYGDFNISDEDVKLTVNYVDVDSHGGSFSVDTPKDGQSYSLQEMKDMVKGMCEDCSGYADISRDGSDILIMVMAPETDENGEFANDYYAAYTVRCTVRIISTSLETFVDYLDKYNAE